MDCIVCNKELTGQQKKFCSSNCANKYWSNRICMDRNIPVEVKRCKKVAEKLKNLFKLSYDDRKNEHQILKTVYAYTATKLHGFSLNVTGAAISKDHTTILYHLSKVDPYIINLAIRINNGEKVTKIERNQYIDKKFSYRSCS